MSHEPQSPVDRIIRIFVSSTFRDMQEDRDWLVKHVFPRLRKLCEARGVTWGEVDLRWGITDEEAAEGKVLPLCLEEINRCRPYFIGLLGERYGWVPEAGKLPADLLQREAWLNDHQNHSVTELEIIHGVLREGERHSRAFFYFRDPDYLDRLPRNREDFEIESPEAKKKLDRLKQRIRAASDEKVCRLRENYQDPKQLGAWILEDFMRLIDEMYPEDEQPQDLDREAAGHTAFARSRAGAYISRQEYFDRLDAHMAGDGPPLVILGESGSGKSALLANWFLDRFCSPTLDSRSSTTFALIHFIGSTADSADVTKLMQRIMLELQRRFHLPGEVPVMPDQIREAFPRWLRSAASAGRIVLILDALNQLDDRDHAPDLRWLPHVLQKNVRLIVSTLPGRSLAVVQSRRWPELTVQPLTVPERRELIEKFLTQFSRRLSPSRVEWIAGAGQTANPLFLRAMLDELRQFGEHDRLGEMIEHYLSAADPQDLYQRILQRWEQDYGKELVGRSLSLLCVARRGLSESELLEVMGTGQVPLPRAMWTPFYLAAEAALAHRSGLLRFSHDYIRAAAAVRFLPTDQQQQSYHCTLADYFHDQPELTDRKLDELPWQWQQADEWASLKGLLTQRDVFVRLRSTERWKQDLQAYWMCLQPHYDPCDAYRQVLDRWEAEASQVELFGASINELAMFHYERAEHIAAEPLFRRAMAILEACYGPEHPNVAGALNNLATLLEATDRLAEAEPLYRRALAIWEWSLGSNHPQVGTALNNLAELLRATNRLAEAEPLFRRALATREQSLGPDHPQVAISLNNLALLLQDRSRLAEAEPLFRRAMAILETSCGPEHPDVARALNNMAELLRATNRLAEAEPLYRRALTILEASYGPDHPDVGRTLNNVAMLLKHTNRLAEAEPLFRRVMAILEASYGPEHPDIAVALSNLADLRRVTNRLAEAELLFRRALAIWERSLGSNHPQVGTALNNLAELLRGTNRLAEAEPLFRRALAITEASYGPHHPDVSGRLNNLALLLQDTSRLAEAEPLFRRSLAITEASYGPHHPDVAIRLNNLAMLLQHTNRLAEAEPLFRRALAIGEASYGPDHPDVALALNNLADLFQAIGRVAEAEPLFRRSLAITEASYGTHHPKVAIRLNNLALLLHKTSRVAEAEPLFRRALAIGEASYGRDHPDVAVWLNNLACLLKDTNRLAEAEPPSRRMLEIFLKFTVATGYQHPHLRAALRNYDGLLQAMGHSDAEVTQELNDLLGQYGMSLG